VGGHVGGHVPGVVPMEESWLTAAGPVKTRTVI
jgi:hypothetical protein